MLLTEFLFDSHDPINNQHTNNYTMSQRKTQLTTFTNFLYRETIFNSQLAMLKVFKLA